MLYVVNNDKMWSVLIVCDFVRYRKYCFVGIVLCEVLFCVDGMDRLSNTLCKSVG